MEIPKIYKMSFEKIYEALINKAIKKGRTKDEVDRIIYWLTGYDNISFLEQIKLNVDLQTFFKQAPKMNPSRKLIKGVICGCRVEEIKESIMQNIRYLDLLIDELAKGKSLDKILRQ